MHRPFEKCGQNVVKFGEFKKKGLVKCLIFSNLQSLFVPRSGRTEVRRNTGKSNIILFVNNHANY